MPITRDGRTGVGITMRDWTAAESDFVLTAAVVEEVIAGGSAGEVTDDDVVYDSRTSATVNQHAQLSASALCEFISLNEAIGTVDDAGFVTRAGDGTVRVLARSAKGQKSIDVALAQLTGQTSNEFLRFASGSLAEHCAQAVDTRLSGKTPETGLPIFTEQSHALGVYVRNAQCWAADLDLTPISPWNTYGGVNKAGTLVSPRHIILAKHYYPLVGMQFRFIDANGAVVTRTMTAMENLAGTDITVGLLDSDVPAGIGFCKVLPDDALDYVPHISLIPDTQAAFGIPGIGLDQEEKALIFEWVSEYSIGSGGYIAAIRHPSADSDRFDFHESIVVGDSGNPFCLIVNDELVLLFTWLGVSGGSSIRYHASAVNSAMTSLGGGYQLTRADLSGFTDFS